MHLKKVRKFYATKPTMAHYTKFTISFHVAKKFHNDLLHTHA
jgi:hypothetical protein